MKNDRLNPKVSLADRVRDKLSREADVIEKRMFGSVGFMIRGKLALSVRESRIMCRIDPKDQPELVKREGCRAVVMQSRRMKGYVYVDVEALKTGRALSYWVKLALVQNKTITQ